MSPRSFPMRRRRNQNADVRGSGACLQVLLPAVRGVPGAGLQMPGDGGSLLLRLALHHALLGRNGGEARWRPALER